MEVLNPLRDIYSLLSNHNEFLKQSPINWISLISQSIQLRIDYYKLSLKLQDVTTSMSLDEYLERKFAYIIVGEVKQSWRLALEELPQGLPEYPDNLPDDLYYEVYSDEGLLFSIKDKTGDNHFGYMQTSHCLKLEFSMEEFLKMISENRSADEIKTYLSNLFSIIEPPLGAIMNEMDKEDGYSPDDDDVLPEILFYEYRDYCKYAKSVTKEIASMAKMLRENHANALTSEDWGRLHRIDLDLLYENGDASHSKYKNYYNDLHELCFFSEEMIEIYNDDRLTLFGYRQDDLAKKALQVLELAPVKPKDFFYWVHRSNIIKMGMDPTGGLAKQFADELCLYDRDKNLFDKVINFEETGGVATFYTATYPWNLAEAMSVKYWDIRNPILETISPQWEQAIPKFLRDGILRNAWEELRRSGLLNADYTLATDVKKGTARLIAEQFNVRYRTITKIKKNSWKPFEVLWGIKNLQQSTRKGSSEKENIILKIFREL